MCPGGLVKSVSLGTTGFGFRFGAPGLNPHRVQGLAAPAHRRVWLSLRFSSDPSWFLSAHRCALLDGERIDVRLDAKGQQSEPLETIRTQKSLPRQTPPAGAVQQTLGTP